MTNEEKARILSNKGCLGAYINRDVESLNPTEEDKKRLSLYGACLEAMDWKDEKFENEKQQLIDKAAEWYRSRFPNMSNEAIEKFKEDMKGE